MKKKKVEAPPQKLGGPEIINRDTYITAMRRLLSNTDYQLLVSRFIDIRRGILEHGKEKPSEAQWSVLKGFDLAVMEAQKWAGEKTRDDKAEDQSKAILDSVAGD
jgi:hypothetical protein